MRGTAANYHIASTDKIYHEAEGKKFAWWTTGSISLSVSDPLSATFYGRLLQVYQEADKIWRGIVEMRSSGWQTLWRDYYWLDSSDGSRKIAYRVCDQAAWYLSVMPANSTTMASSLSISTAGLGSSSIFYMIPYPGSGKPDEWAIKTPGGAKVLMARINHDTTQAVTGEAAFFPVSANPTPSLWKVTRFGLSYPLGDRYTLGDMIGRNHLWVRTSSVPSSVTTIATVTAEPPCVSGMLFFIEDLSKNVPTGVAHATTDMKTWNEIVIPTLLLYTVNGKSPLVDQGAIGVIARSWELDPNVDKTMVDAVKTNYCLSNPKSPECACLSRRTIDPTYTAIKKSFPTPDRCWYKNCLDVPGNGRILITKALVDDTKCVNVCQSLIQIIGSTGVNLADAQQITTCPISSTPTPDPTPAVAAGGLTDKQKMTLALAGGSAVVVFAVLGITLVLVLAKK